jgi:hypothetical protein
MKKAFQLGLLICLVYYFAWYLFRILGWHWYTSLNIPGFFLLMCSFPWSYVVLENLILVKDVFCQVGRDLLIVLFVSVGFAINTTIMAWCIRAIRFWFKTKVQNQRNT